MHWIPFDPYKDETPFGDETPKPKDSPLKPVDGD